MLSFGFFLKKQFFKFFDIFSSRTKSRSATCPFGARRLFSRKGFAKIRLIEFCRLREASLSLELELGEASRNKKVNERPPDFA